MSFYPFTAKFSARGLCRVGLLCWAMTQVQAADPTAEQQYWLELTNRFRLDPQAELAKLVNFSAPGVWAPVKSNDPYVANALNFFGTSAVDLAAQWTTLTAAPALAWNNSLAASSLTYSDLMVAMDQQSHTLDGLTIQQRISSSYGSNWLKVGENLFAATQNVTHGQAAFVIDWGDGNGATAGFGNGIQNPAGHRLALLDREFKEMGIGFQSSLIPGTNTQVTGPIVTTEHFGSHYRLDGGSYYSDAILTGSIYQDTISADAFYTPGEGLGGIAIQVYNDATNALVASGTTNSVGGYNITLTGLTTGVVYRAEAPAAGVAAQTFTLNMSIVNYGQPVNVYDNVYASFQAAPEPGSAFLCLIAATFACAFRRRNQ